MGQANWSGRRLALLADDHALFRAGAAALLTRRCGYDAVVQAGSLDEALFMLEDVPEIALACFDLGMPGVGNPTNLRQVRDLFPSVRLVVMTGSETRENILLALQSGVHGYVPKSLPMEEIIRALRIVGQGGIYVPQQLAEVEPDDRHGEPRFSLERKKGPPQDPTIAVELTKRQDEILGLIRLGRTNKEIGLSLRLAENTVKVHVNALFRKLGVHTRQQAAALEGERAARGERANPDTGRVGAIGIGPDNLDA